MCWHKWDKWSQTYPVKVEYVDEIFGDYLYTNTEQRQRKQCTKCGKIKERKVSG